MGERAGQDDIIICVCLSSRVARPLSASTRTDGSTGGVGLEASLGSCSGSSTQPFASPPTSQNPLPTVHHGI
eukprot:2031507-Rhodomonas_salina.1